MNTLQVSKDECTANVANDKRTVSMSQDDRTVSISSNTRTTQSLHWSGLSPYHFQLKQICMLANIPLLLVHHQSSGPSITVPIAKVLI